MEKGKVGREGKEEREPPKTREKSARKQARPGRELESSASTDRELEFVVAALAARKQVR
jgi:hypothetical protein